MDFKDIAIAVGLFVGTAAGALVVGMRSKMSKSVEQISAQVRGVVVPLETISSNVDTLRDDMRDVKSDLAVVKEDQKETKLEVRKAVNDRQLILTELATLKGIEQGRRDEADRRAEAQKRGARR